MHFEILSQAQKELLPFIGQFKKEYYLVGGTAIALHLGHRQSIDFDLFTSGKVQRLKIRKIVEESGTAYRLLSEDSDQIHFLLNNVKITFFAYPYKVAHPCLIDSVVTMPSLLSLAAMKAFALGRRAKWKDYVDLHFLLRDHFSVAEVSLEAQKYFGDSFSDRLFREQLAYHADIDYTEPVEFMPGYAVEPEKVRALLIDKALEGIL